MNKRIKNKKTKQRQLKILNEISKYFSIKKASFGNGYFLFTFGKNMVCHFELRELPEWKFGIWLEDKNNDFQFFGEHKLLIDKFKPSATYISKNIKEFGQIKRNIVPTIQSVINKPYYHFDKSLHFGLHVSEDSKKTYEDFIEEKKEEHWNEVSKYLNMKRKIKELEENPLVDYIEIKDRNSKYFTSYPRYEINIVLKDKYDNKDEETYNQMVESIESAYDNCRAEIYWYE